MEIRYRIKVEFVWWLDLHIRSVALFAALTGMEPDMAKMEAKILRGTRMLVERLPNP
ncbi:hypothetical protein ACKZDW_02395 (plasmid) [Ralstonia syzygii subsp. celebesensis]|uniref:hypothetical protein n=1 Tax=Ralstonia syzygii TaxID=28097 RepID=UPI00387E1A24